MPTAKKQWTIRYNAPVQLMNAQASKNWRANVEIKRQWREAGFISAKEFKIPSLTTLEVDVLHHQLKKGRKADIGAVMPSVKAFIDGLVDADVLPDDGPDYLTRLTFSGVERTDTSGITFTLTTKNMTKKKHK